MSETKYTPDGRPFSPADRYHMYMWGWRDGASFHVVRHPGYPDYEAGYSAGRTDYSYASQIATKRTGYSPSILRAEDTVEEEPNSVCAKCGMPNPIAGPYCNRPSCGQKG